jgi:hypothetical protein
MNIAVAGLVVTTLGLLISLAFNCLQYKWRKEERAQHQRESAEARAEQLRKERMPPEFYNMDGTLSPIRIRGSQHSAKGPFVDVWGLITVLNPTQSPMKVTPRKLVINGAEWEVTRFAFHLRANPSDRYDRISLLGNDKQDYELHFFFPEDKWPKAMSGELRLTSSNRADEPFSMPVSFA